MLKKTAVKKQSSSRIWQLLPQKPGKSALLAREFKIPQQAAQVLLNRGINSTEAGKKFLYPDLAQLHSPFLMRDMDCAVDIIWAALRQGKRDRKSVV